MEPVIFPQTFAARSQPDRVTRAKSRGDSGKGPPFSKQMRQEKETASGSDSPPREDSGGSPAAAAAGEPDASSGRFILPADERRSRPDKKMIDVRV